MNIFRGLVMEVGDHQQDASPGDKARLVEEDEFLGFATYEPVG